MAEAARPKGKAAAAPAPFWRQAGAALWQGFSEPSVLAFRVFCGMALATLAFCLWFFSTTTLAGPMGAYLPRSGIDAEGFATREALRTGHRAPLRPRLIVLGTSTLAQALGPAKVLSAALKDGTGEDWEVVNLATPLQSPTDQFALAETALESQRADSPPALVALGFGVQRLRWTPEQVMQYVAHPRLGLSSAWADGEIRALGGDPPARTGLYAWDNLPFYLLNGSEAMLRVLLHRPAKRVIDQYATGKPHHDPRVRATLGAEIRDGAARQGDYFAQIARLAALVAAVPNARLVLVEEPLSPDLIAEQDLAGLRDRLALAAAEAGLPAYWPIVDEAGLGGEDFFDDLHVMHGPPQDRVQAALAGHVIAEQLERGMDGDGN